VISRIRKRIYHGGGEYKNPNLTTDDTDLHGSKEFKRKPQRAQRKSGRKSKSKTLPLMTLIGKIG
jgi:hypothetical protein